MKKVLFIVAVLVLTASCTSKKDYKYMIETPNNYFYTDSYTVKDGCVSFEEECNCTESGKQASTVCGSYTITTLQ